MRKFDMRFGAIETFLDFSGWEFRMGRPVANESFLKALLTYGSFDEYEFFCSDLAHQEKFRQKITEKIRDSGLLNRVKTPLRIDLAKSLQSKQYAVFHLGDFTYFMPYLIDMRNRLSNRPFPVTGVTHSLDGVFMNLRYLELIFAGMREYDGIVCTSDAAKKAVDRGRSFVRQQLETFVGNSVSTKGELTRIPLGIDDSSFEIPDKLSARKFLQIPREAVVALSVGRFSPRQKTDWSPILELLARMNAAGKLDQFLLIIAGGAEEAEISLLQSLVSGFGLEQKVVLFSNFPAEVKTKLYAAADFYISIVDNFQETFGLSVVEAMASGLPVIASDFSGYRELLQNNREGFLIPTIRTRELPEFIDRNLGILNPSLAKLYLAQTVAVDLEELQNAVLTFLTSSNLRGKMGFLAKQRAQEFRWENIIKKYETFWRELGQKSTNIKPAVKSESRGILTGDFLHTFSHYPSQKIKDSDLIAMTDTGRSSLNGDLHFTKYGDVESSLSLPLERFILEKIANEDMTVALLKQGAAENFFASSAQTEYQLIWLLKHGAIKLRR